MLKAKRKAMEMEDDRKSMTGEAIVLFLDVLGYKGLVKNGIYDSKLVQELKDLWVGIIRLSKYENLPEGAPHRDYIHKVVRSAMSVRFISDTFLFSLRLSDITPDSDFNDSESIAAHIWVYLYSIAMFCPTFIGKTGLIMRGGIAKGPHYEKDIDNNIFLFSKAYIDAYELHERNQQPRIVADDKLIAYLREIQFNYLDAFFYKEHDNTICFDWYFFFEFGDPRSKKLLRDIKSGLITNIRASVADDSARTKLKCFVEYHNRKMSEAGEDYKEFTIDTGIFEKES